VRSQASSESFKLGLSDQTNDFRRAYLPFSPFFVSSFFSSCTTTLPSFFFYSFFSSAKAGALNVTATAMIAIKMRFIIRHPL